MRRYMTLVEVVAAEEEGLTEEVIKTRIRSALGGFFERVGVVDLEERCNAQGCSREPRFATGETIRCSCGKGLCEKHGPKHLRANPTHEIKRPR